MKPELTIKGLGKAFRVEGTLRTKLFQGREFGRLWEQQSVLMGLELRTQEGTESGRKRCQKEGLCGGESRQSWP